MIIKLIQPKMLLRPMDTAMKTRMVPSLALLTIAKITQKQHNIVIENENIEEINFESKVDLVGITITVDTLPKAIEIASKFRKRNKSDRWGNCHF